MFGLYRAGLLTVVATLVLALHPSARAAGLRCLNLPAGQDTSLVLAAHNEFVGGTFDGPKQPGALVLSNVKTGRATAITDQASPRSQNRWLGPDSKGASAGSYVLRSLAPRGTSLRYCFAGKGVLIGRTTRSSSSSWQTQANIGSLDELRVPFQGSPLRGAVVLAIAKTVNGLAESSRVCVLPRGASCLPTNDLGSNIIQTGPGSSKVVRFIVLDPSSERNSDLDAVLQFASAPASSYSLSVGVFKRR
jgi:hypothetical protein